MTHCNCPKTRLSAITTWQEHRYNHVSISAHSNASQTIYHYVFAFTPLYFSISTFTSFPTKTSVNLLMLQIDWSQSPPSLPDVNHVCGENHVLPQRMALQDLFAAPGYGFWTWWWCFSTSNQTVLPYQTLTFYFPSGWQLVWCLYLHTLYHQDTPTVDVAGFAVTIWLI